MRTLILAFIALLMAPAIGIAEPQRIPNDHDSTAQPCDNDRTTTKPPCNADSESIKVPKPLPNERDSTLVPPDIPAEGLPNRDKAPTPGADPSP